MTILWLETAKKYLGQKEIAGVNNNQSIVNFFKRVGHRWVTNDETPWCAAFVGAVLQECDIESTRSLRALSYAKWGVEIKYPAVGALAVLERTNKAGKVIGGHVTFVAGRNKNNMIIGLGGNQSDMVNYAAFNPNKIITYRWPSEYTLPVQKELPVLDIGTLYNDK